MVNYLKSSGTSAFEVRCEAVTGGWKVWGTKKANQNTARCRTEKQK